MGIAIREGGWKPDMDKTEFLEAIDGLWAYDTGCVDSGIHDEVLRTKVIQFLDSEPKKTLEWLGEHAVQLLTSSQGYTLEDVHGLMAWLEDRMHYSV